MYVGVCTVILRCMCVRTVQGVYMVPGVCKVPGVCLQY